MKAAIRKKYGLPDVIKIEEIDKPSPKEGEVLIKVHNTTVNRTDCANLTAKPSFIMHLALGFPKPKKVIIGTDFSGEIAEIGSNVTSFKLGDRVFGFNDMVAESHAEYLTMAANEVFPIPEGINFKQAAASLEGAHYAYTFVHKTNIQPGQQILINGATGAIGSALLQFVKQFKVHITATCNSKNMELIKSLGADNVIDYTKEDFTKSSKKYDYIFDSVGKSTFSKCKSILTSKGIYISSEMGPFGQNIYLPLITAMTKKKVIFPIPYDRKKTIPYISNLLKQGKFTPVIDREYTLNDISKAYEYVLKGQKTGNVLIQITNS